LPPLSNEGDNSVWTSSLASRAGLRASVHDIEARVDQLHEPALLVSMLMMRTA